mgnify:CR=1 FL=1
MKVDTRRCRRPCRWSDGLGRQRLVRLPTSAATHGKHLHRAVLALARPGPLQAALVPVSHALARGWPARRRRALRIALHARTAADLRRGAAQGKG